VVGLRRLVVGNSRTKRRAKGPWPLVGESKLSIESKMSALDKCSNKSIFNLLDNK
jgi:hypothetical protein